MANSRKSVFRRDVIAWSMYDFANTIYSMNVVSLYLKRLIVEDQKYDDRYFDIPFAVSMLFAALLMPGLGALSDHSGRKKAYVTIFTVVCCAAVAAMGLVSPGLVGLTIILFITANFCYEASMPFYNSLLYSVADGAEARFVSGIGVALGYVGSVVGMILILPFVTGSLFSLDIPFLDGGGKQAAFLPTAILFLLFSLPLFLVVHELSTRKPGSASLRTAYREVWDSLRQTRKYPGVLRFLIADYFIEDAVATVILNIGLYSSIVFGMADAEITIFLVISTITAVIGSFIIGRIAEFWSLKSLMTIIVFGWVAALAVFVLTDNRTAIWILGSVVGILLGGLWTTTRPYLAELVPRDELGRFFGLFALSGRAAAVVGPLVWTTIVYLFRPERPLGRILSEWLGQSPDAAARLPYKLGVASLALMMLVGLFILRKVPHTHKGLHG